MCPLCTEGYEAPTVAPDLLGHKRKLGVITDGGVDQVSSLVVDSRGAVAQRQQRKKARAAAAPSTRLFVGRLPLVVTASALRNAVVAYGGQFARVETVQWCVDRDSGAYYGSAFVSLGSVEQAQSVIQAVARYGGLEVESGSGAGPAGMSKARKAGKVRKAIVNFAPLRDGESWPADGHKETEFPPLGNVM